MKIVVPGAALLLSACASFSSNYAVNSTSNTEPVDGQILTANVGEVVVRKGRYSTATAIRVEADVKTGVLGENRIGAGYYLKHGEDAKSEYFLPEPGRNGGRITHSPVADPISGLQAYKDRQKLCTVSVLNFHDCRNDVAFTRVERLVVAPDSVQRHLIYAGRSGDKLTFGYVESANLLPRSNADGRVEHDLAASRRVTVKGMAFEVIDATADAIRYRIIASDDATA